MELVPGARHIAGLAEEGVTAPGLITMEKARLSRRAVDNAPAF